MAPEENPADDFLPSEEEWAAFETRAGVIKDPAGYADFSRSHPRCMACGIPEAAAIPFGLSNHHICKPGRSDDLCNLLRLCAPCHNLAEGHVLYREGQTVGPLSLAICLSLKMLRDPEHYDPERLAVLYRRALPDPQPIPQFFLDSWHRWVNTPEWLGDGCIVRRIRGANSPAAQD